MTSSRSVAPRRQQATRRIATVCMFALVGAFTIAPNLACAAPQVRGTPNAVRLNANNATIDQIMAALGRAFSFHYTSSAHLDQRISGVYEGSLAHVVARLLASHNFVLKRSNGQIDVTVYVPHAQQRRVVASGAPSPANPSRAAVAKPRVKKPQVAANKPTAPRAPQPTKSAQATAHATSSQSPPLMRLVDATQIAPPKPAPSSGDAPEPKPSTLAPPIPTKVGTIAPPMPTPGKKLGLVPNPSTTGSHPVPAQPLQGRSNRSSALH